MAEFKVKGLRGPCPGRPRRGGAASRRKYLLSGIHPVHLRPFSGSQFFPQTLLRERCLRRLADEKESSVLSVYLIPRGRSGSLAAHMEK